MKAEIKTNNGRGKVFDTLRNIWYETDVVQHWTLYVDGHYIGATSIPQISQLFIKIAEKINKAEA